MKALDQISAKVYERGFDGSRANVHANRDGFVRKDVGTICAHNRCALYALYAILVGHPCGIV